VPPLQVICHGMMAFKLPTPDLAHTLNYNIVIHIPYVTDDDDHMYDHVYKAGERATAQNYDKIDLDQDGAYTLNLSSYTPQGTLPASLYPSANVFLFSPDNKCKCKVPASGKKAYCTITLPVPQDYQGYGAGFNGDQSPLFDGSGNDVKHCSDPFHPKPHPAEYSLDKLKTVPLVHVFRYDYTSASLVDAAQKVKWDTSNGKTKLFIYAEPKAATLDPSNTHLKKLAALMGTDLDFSCASLLTGSTGTTDNLIDDPKDLYSLADWSNSSTSGGNPADCISGYGS
jgi:hypothetical protein